MLWFGLKEKLGHLVIDMRSVMRALKYNKRSIGRIETSVSTHGSQLQLHGLSIKELQSRTSKIGVLEQFYDDRIDAEKELRYELIKAFDNKITGLQSMVSRQSNVIDSLRRLHFAQLEVNNAIAEKLEELEKEIGAKKPARKRR